MEGQSRQWCSSKMWLSVWLTCLGRFWVHILNHPWVPRAYNVLMIQGLWRPGGGWCYQNPVEGSLWRKNKRNFFFPPMGRGTSSGTPTYVSLPCTNSIRISRFIILDFSCLIYVLAFLCCMKYFLNLQQVLQSCCCPLTSPSTWRFCLLTCKEHPAAPTVCPIALPFLYLTVCVFVIFHPPITPWNKLSGQGLSASFLAVSPPLRTVLGMW